MVQNISYRGKIAPSNTAPGSNLMPQRKENQSKRKERIPISWPNKFQLLVQSYATKRKEIKQRKEISSAPNVLQNPNRLDLKIMKNLTISEKYDRNPTTESSQKVLLRG